ncbi:DUF1003 domain-containing protein [Kyrpidia spormannii]|nr:DUF1003 domain-containing protein [Kyrpidia spormannii]
MERRRIALPNRLALLRRRAHGQVAGFTVQVGAEDAERINHLVEEYHSRILSRIEEEYNQSTTAGDRAADRITAFGGSWRFIGIFSLFLVLWMIWNILRPTPHFDPYPFILLNLVLSCLAAFQAPIIMMSQNRQAARDRHESIIDFAINYKAQREIDDIQGHLHRIERDIAALKSRLDGSSGAPR